MESLRLKSKEGSAKVVGALLCFGGALLLSLYSGKELHLFTPVIKGITKSSNGVAGGQHHMRGTLLLLGDCICYAFWYPIQVCQIMIQSFHTKACIYDFVGKRCMENKKFLHTRNDLSMEMHSNEGERVSAYPRRPYAEAFHNAVDVVDLLRAPPIEYRTYGTSEFCTRSAR